MARAKCPPQEDRWRLKRAGTREATSSTGETRCLCGPRLILVLPRCTVWYLGYLHTLSHEQQLPQQRINQETFFIFTVYRFILPLRCIIIAHAERLCVSAETRLCPAGRTPPAPHTVLRSRREAHTQQRSRMKMGLPAPQKAENKRTQAKLENMSR